MLRQHSVTGPSGYPASQDLQCVCMTKTHNTHYILIWMMHMLWPQPVPACLFGVICASHCACVCCTDWETGWSEMQSASWSCGVEIKNVLSWHILYDIMESHLEIHLKAASSCGVTRLNPKRNTWHKSRSLFSIYKRWMVDTIETPIWCCDIQYRSCATFTAIVK